MNFRSIYSSDDAGLLLDPLDSLLFNVPEETVFPEASPPVVREPSPVSAGGGVLGGLVVRPVPLPFGFCVPPSTT